MVRVSDVVEFIRETFPEYYDREDISHIVLLHMKYNTFEYEVDEKGITYVMRYNVCNKTCHALDLAIRKDKRGLRYLKYIIGQAWQKWPTLEYFMFKTNKHEKERIYKIGQVFKGGVKNGKQANSNSTNTASTN